MKSEWLTYEETFLRMQYKKTSIEAIAKALQMDVKDIKLKAIEIGLEKKTTIKDKRLLRQSQGLCVQCGNKMDREGTCCIRCNNANNESKMNRRRRLRGEGKCHQCGKPLDRDGVYCKVCVDKMNITARNKNKKRKELGLCRICGIKVEDGKSYCTKCLEAIRLKRKINNNKQRRD
jgi:predicted amidophosphoribosyltransferase